MAVNKVMLIGNVGKDPEIRTLNSGDKCATFSLAVTEKWRDRQSGERKERTEWVNVSVFNEGIVGIIEQYVHKGSKLFVEGKFQTRKWQDKDGADRYSTEVVIQNFGGQIELLGDPTGDRDSGGDRGRSGGDRGGGGRTNDRDRGSGNDRGGARQERESFSADLNDEIPF